MGFITRGLPRVVIPAKAGIQELKLDAGSGDCVIILKYACFVILSNAKNLIITAC